MAVRTGLAGSLAVALGCAASDEPAEPGPGDAVWNRVEDDREDEDRALDVAVGPDGSVVVVGMLGGSDAFVHGHAPGGDRTWSRVLASGERSLASAVVIDEAGNIVVSGARFSAAEDWDPWVVALTSTGEIRWERGFAGAAQREDQAVGISLGPGAGVFVAGYDMLEDGTTDAWLRSLDAEGNENWIDVYDGPARGVDVATEVAWWAPGDLVVATGYTTAQDERSQTWLRAYDGAGNIRWTQVLADGERGTSVAIDTLGILVVGTTVVPGRTVDAWIGRFDFAGSLQWSRTHDGPLSLGDGANDVAIARDGSFAVGGYQLGTGGAWDAWTRYHAPDGTPLWTHVYDHDPSIAGDDLVAGVAIDEVGDVLVAGCVATGEETRAVWLSRLRGR